MRIFPNRIVGHDLAVCSRLVQSDVNMCVSWWDRIVPGTLFKHKSGSILGVCHNSGTLGTGYSASRLGQYQHTLGLEVLTE